MSLSQSQKMAIMMTEEEIEGATFDAYVKATGHKKPFKLDIDRALSLESMEGKKDDVLSCEIQEDFCEFQDSWEDAMEVSNDIIAAVSQTCSDISSHFATRERAQVRK